MVSTSVEMLLTIRLGTVMNKEISPVVKPTFQSQRFSVIIIITIIIMHY
jgi:hypothetical protein